MSATPRTFGRPVTAAEEQEWNEAQLSAPVISPRIAFWSYRATAVVLGSSQHDDEVRRAAARTIGADLAHRRSGGGAVLAGPWLLSVSVVLPPDHPLVDAGVVASYRWIGEAHASALRSLGIDAEALSASALDVRRAPGRDRDLRWACFGALSPWEVVAPRDRKVVGLAQVRRRHGVLFVAGTLLADPDWLVLCRVLGMPPTAAVTLAGRTSSCAQELRRAVGSHEVAAALEPRLRAALAAGGP